MKRRAHGVRLGRSPPPAPRRLCFIWIKQASRALLSVEAGTQPDSRQPSREARRVVMETAGGKRTVLEEASNLL